MKSHAKKRQSNHAKIGKLERKIFKNLFKASITLDLPVDRVTLLSECRLDAATINGTPSNCLTLHWTRSLLLTYAVLYAKHFYWVFSAITTLKLHCDDSIPNRIDFTGVVTYFMFAFRAGVGSEKWNNDVTISVMKKECCWRCVNYTFWIIFTK